MTVSAPDGNAILVNAQSSNNVWIANGSEIGGNDVFVDIGDKSYGVMACQKYLGGIEASKTLHVGDQFLSTGANDFKVPWAISFTQSVTNYARHDQLVPQLG